MITPSDNSYKQTKLIKLGKATINEDFADLARWIDHTYGVQTMNIVYDTIDDGQRPRLEIIFEFHADVIKFTSGFSYDPEKQKAIAKEFVSRIKSPEKYKTENVLVIFDAFAPMAIVESYQRIPESQIQILRHQLNMKDLWEISRFFSSATFFFFTDQQVEENNKNGMKEIIADKYFELLKAQDRFDYIKREQFSVSLDSKENFDKNYQSNWYYYYK